MKWVRDPLVWLILFFIALLLVLPHSTVLFSTLFPQLPRPVYQQESFISLTLAHFWLVGISSLIAIILGVNNRKVNIAVMANELVFVAAANGKIDTRIVFTVPDNGV